MGALGAFSRFLTSEGGLPRLFASARAKASLARRCWGVCAWTSQGRVGQYGLDVKGGCAGEEGYHCEMRRSFGRLDWEVELGGRRVYGLREGGI